MQPFGPRTSVPQGNVYTAAQIQAALLAPTARLEFVFDLLSPYGAYAGDLTPFVSLTTAPVLDHDSSKAAPRTLQLAVRGDSGIDPVQQLVRMRSRLQMADNDFVDFVLATLLLQPNQERRNSGGKWLDLQGVDLTQALIDAQFTRSYSVSAGTDGGVALSALISGYGGLFPLQPLIPAINKPLPVPLVWEAGKNRLLAANAILAAFGCMPLWVDEMGRPRSAPLPDYSQLQPAFAYDLATNDGLGDAITSKADPSKAYRTVEVLVEDPNRTPFAVTYVSPISSPVLPTWRPKVLVLRNSTLADADAAFAFARSQQQQSLREASGAFTIPSLPWPLSQHLDVYSAVLSNADDGPQLRSFVESRWSLTVKPGGATMTRYWQPIAA